MAFINTLSVSQYSLRKLEIHFGSREHMLLRAKNGFYKCHFFFEKKDVFIVAPKWYVQISRGKTLAFWPVKEKTSWTPNVTRIFVFFTDEALLSHMAWKLSSTLATLIWTSTKKFRIFEIYLLFILILLFIREHMLPRAKNQRLNIYILSWKDMLKNISHESII